MLDIFLVLSNLLFGISILAYFYFREVKNQNRDFEKFKELNELMSLEVEVLQEGYKESLKAIVDTSESKDNLTQKALLEYLKHNERLEKMILPQPVTKRAVQEILDQTPTLVPNEIDKMDKELEQDQLNDLLTRIPITKSTKVMFEGDDGITNGLAEEIIPDMMSGHLG